MAGRHNKAESSEADAKAPDAAAADSSELQTHEAADSLKTEESDAHAADVVATTEKSETAEPESSETQPAAESANDDAASRGSSGSDDKATTSSPSKKSSSKSKKGGRISRGRSNGSKRTSDELEPAKDENADAAQTIDPSGSTATPNDADAPQSGAEATGAGQDASEGNEQVAASSAPEDAPESASAGTNGRENAHPKGTPASKELAQLGLGSFGDGADDALGPRRSRRGPGASPDPKARIPKTEPDTDTTSLQAVSHEYDEAGDTKDGTVGDDNAEPVADAAGDNPSTNGSPATAHNEAAVTANGDADTKIETENDHGLEAQEETSQEVGEGNNHEGQPEEGEVEFANADEADADGEEGGDEGVTRCVCGSADENVGLMIQCETCKCWQHCVCMGMQVEEDCPDVYFCEQCRPELHIPLLRSLGLLPKAAKKSNGKGAKYSARELKEAKDAIALLAQENARRTQAAEAAAAAVAYNSRDRKGGAHARNDASKEAPKSPKRRSTMNSRDSAYSGWEPIPPGLLADGEGWDGQDDRKGGKKRKRGLPDDPNDSSAETPEIGAGGDESASAAADASKRRRMSASGVHDHDGDAEMEEDDGVVAAEHLAASTRDKSKKKKGNNQYTVREASATAEASSSKPRHPNQYTYRNKDRSALASANGPKAGTSSTSNLTSHSPSPSPSKGRAEHARRAAVRDNGGQLGTPAPGDSSSSSGRGMHAGSTTQWGLPEHLTHLAYLLPGSGHRNGMGKSSGFASGDEAGNGGAGLDRKGSSSGSGSSVPSPPASGSVPTPFHVLSSIESSTKVRFPSRRMTLGEMRKRVRNIGEYVTRSQIEAVEREKRMKLLGVMPPYVEEMEEEAAMEAEAMQNDAADATATPAEPATEQNADSEKQEAQSVGSRSRQQPLPLSMRLMEELTRELIQFQRRFGVGPGTYGNLGNSQQSASVN